LQLTFYFVLLQVLWLGVPQCKATWEPASSVPQDLMADFEAGVTTEVDIDTTSAYGHVSNTMTVTHKPVSQPEVKKRKEERPCHEELEG